MGNGCFCGVLLYICRGVCEALWGGWVFFAVVLVVFCACYVDFDLLWVGVSLFACC